MGTPRRPPESVPQVSVLLPAYNAQSHVREAVESILAQTFAAFELIVIDDGSTDGTLGVLQQIAARDARVRLVSRPNRGLVATLNEAMLMATAPWLARMDADDVALPTRLAAQLEFMQRTGADISGTWIRCIGEGEGEVISQPVSPEGIRAAMLFGTVFAHPTVMMRASLARQLRYDPQWDKCEDYDLWERAQGAGAVLRNLPEVLLHYRRHPGQASETSARQQQALAQDVRRRAWSGAVAAGWVSEAQAEAVLALRETSGLPDMDLVDQAFGRLIGRLQGEPRDVVLDHMTRLYFRAAPAGLSVAWRWRAVHTRYGIRPARVIGLKLWLICLLRLQAGRGLYAWLQSADRRLRGTLGP